MLKVLISGGWDLMHDNHVQTLRKAKEFGDYLVVNVLSDERMHKKKGIHRPFQPLAERMNVVRELRCVDEVISIPGEKYPLYKAIDAAKPDIVLINIDEQPDISNEENYCRARRIRVIGLHRIDEGVSTTKLVEILKSA